MLALADIRRAGARLVVTGCMAERYGEELADALPEVDLVAPFGTSLTGCRGRPTDLPFARAPIALGPKPGLPRPAQVPTFDLLNLPRPAAAAPWAYIKVAEGCDRNCGFCAIPSFRGKQRSRTADSILAEVDQLGATERCERSCWWPRTSRRSAGPVDRKDRPAARRPRHRAPVPSSDLVGRGLGPGAVDPAAVPLPLDARRRTGRDHPGHRCSLLRPLPPARVATPAEADAAVGRGRPVPRADPVHPRRPSRRPRSGRRSSSAIRGRQRRTTTDCSNGSARPNSTGSGSSRSATKPAPTPPGCPTRSPPGWWLSGCASAPSCRTPSRPHGGEQLIGSTVEVLVDCPGRSPELPRGARDRRDRAPCPRDLPVGSLRRRGGHRGRRA